MKDEEPAEAEVLLLIGNISFEESYHHAAHSIQADRLMWLFDSQLRAHTLL